VGGEAQSEKVGVWAYAVSPFPPALLVTRQFSASLLHCVKVHALKVIEEKILCS